MHGLKVGHYLLTKMISCANASHFMLYILNINSYFKNTLGITN
jgi:hypothetical protein